MTLTGHRLSVLWIGLGGRNGAPIGAADEDYAIAYTGPSDAQKGIAAVSPDIIAIEETPLTTESSAICTRLARMSRVPVVIVSSTADEESMLRAYRAGAADYILLPAQPVELRARLSVTAQRHRYFQPEIVEQSCLTIGGLKVYPRERRVSLGKRQLQLTTTEFDLLLCLARAAGHPVSHRELLETVWGPEYANCRNYLRLYIRYLRAKIEAQPDRPRLIVNERGIGYRLISARPARTAKTPVF